MASPGRSPLKFRLHAAMAPGLFLTVAALNLLLLLFNNHTRLLWLTWVLWINFGPGRRAEEKRSWRPLMRTFPWYRSWAELQPISLVKTADLPPEGRYLLSLHPHGIHLLSALPCFGSEALGFGRRFPGIDIHGTTLELNFQVPLMREWYLLHGYCTVARRCLLAMLDRPGAAVYLVPGGAQESLMAEPGTYDLVLRRRKGFVGVALQTGARLVPCIAFGENDLYGVHRPAPGSGFARLQHFLKRTLTFTLPQFYGQSLFIGKHGLIPFQVPVTMVVGAPLDYTPAAGVELRPAAAAAARSSSARGPAGYDPSSPGWAAAVDAYHAQYVRALQELWDGNKDRYARKRRRSLRIVE